MQVPEQFEWDAFVSHASEDKESFVEPLVKELQRLGLSIWFDKFTLRVGSSLRQSIDEGLANSRFGIVVLSHRFFAKNWPAKELSALFARQVNGHNLILPIWHQLTTEDILRYSPLVSDIVALNSSRGIGEIASSLVDVISPPHPVSGPPTPRWQSSPPLSAWEQSIWDALKVCLNSGTKLLISPIIPRASSQGQFNLVKLDSTLIYVEKGTGQEISIPLRCVADVLPEAPGRPFRLLLTGRLQWISTSRLWQYHLDPPQTAAQRQYGFEKLSSLNDPRPKQIAELLKQKGIDVGWANEKRLPDLMACGRQIVYDDDGLYFRIPSSPTSSILIASSA